MKVFQIILALVLSVIIPALFMATIAPKSFSVKKEIVINKNTREIFAYLKILKNQDNFSAWAVKDPVMKKEYRGTDGTVGFVAAWDSQVKNIGTGEQVIKKIIEGERIDFEVRMTRPCKSAGSAYFKTMAVSDLRSKVIWGAERRMSFPMNLVLLFSNIEKEYGHDLTAGLSRLKTVLETMPADQAIDISPTASVSSRSFAN